MIKNYIFGAQAVILMYDITNYDSFADLEDWFRLVQTTFASHDMPYVALVGNKSAYRPSCDWHARVVKRRGVQASYVKCSCVATLPGA